MKYRWSRLLFGLAVGAAVALAACAPAEEDTSTTPSTSTSGSSATTGTGSTGDTMTPKTDDTMTPKTDDAMTPKTDDAMTPKTDDTMTPKTDDTMMKDDSASSVSGVPLNDDAKYGGTLNVSYTREGPTFSSWEEAAGVAFSMGHPIHNMLLQPRTWGTIEDYNNLVFFEIHPDLAYEWEVSEDGLEWVFKIRDGIQWSDGTPFTCADAKWSFDSIRTGEGLNRSPRALAFNTVKPALDEGFVCADDLTLIVNHDRPKAAFLEVMSMPYHYMRPKHIYENNTDLLREAPAEVGTGPFSLGQWLPGESYTFERRDGLLEPAVPVRG